MRWFLAAAMVLAACAAPEVRGGAAGDESVRPEPRVVVSAPVAAPTVAAVPATAPKKPAETFTQYAWLDGKAEGVPKPVESLESRFPAEKGFARVTLAPESFGFFLRKLPLAEAGTPVLSFRGDVIREPNHPNIAAVVALDIGKGDLQQCADAVIRMHAEWRYSRGHRDQAYRAASGTKLSFQGYLAGERVKVDNNKISLVTSSRPTSATHDVFRAFLNEVFEWSNTAALSRDGEHIALDALQPGDFFVLTGVPFGHTVLVLDMARDKEGHRAVLLGQSYVPAQSYQVIRQSPKSAWFVINEAEGAITTPFWQPFPFDSLRRLPE